MQAEHHLRETEARVVDRNPRSGRPARLRGRRRGRSRGSRRRSESAALPGGRSPHGRGRSAVSTARGSVAPRNSLTSAPAMKPDFLAERMTSPVGPLAFQRRQHLVEFLDHIGRQRVGAGAFAVEQQPGDAVGVAGQLEIAIGPARVGLRPEFEHAIAENVHDPGIHDHTVSINIAPPCPPPMHSVAMPRLVPSRFMALTRCSTMRLPLQPTGWPRLIAPPSTFSLAWSICAGGAVEAENLAAEFFVVPGGEAAQHLRRERLVQFPGLDILRASVCCASTVRSPTAPGRAP